MQNAKAKEKSGPFIIGFTGKIGSGKSTAANLLYQAWPTEENKAVKIYAFAQPLKDAMKAAFGFSHEQLHGKEKEVVDPRYGVTPRHILQRVGTDWFRDRLATDCHVRMQGPSLWVERFRQYVAKHWATASLIVVEDCRFEDEAAAIQQLGGVVVRVMTPDDEKEFQQAKEFPPTVHVSEQGAFQVDATIMNEKTNKLNLLSDIFEVVVGLIP
jgi:energy-coupling factor transporter ATP-binding protein EcfA2